MISRVIAWRPTRRFGIVAALLLTGLYLAGPQPHATWQAAMPATSAVYACPSSYRTIVPPTQVPTGRVDFFGAPTYVLTGGLCQNGANTSAQHPSLVTVASLAQLEQRRVALYLVGLKWRLFDVDLLNAIWNGFAAGSTYR